MRSTASATLHCDSTKLSIYKYIYLHPLFSIYFLHEYTVAIDFDYTQDANKNKLLIQSVSKGCSCQAAHQPRREAVFQRPDAAK